MILFFRKDDFLHNKKIKATTKSSSSLFCNVKIEELNKDNSYAVFITYIEIYNNVVYDLLEDTSDETRQR